MKKQSELIPLFISLELGLIKSGGIGYQNLPLTPNMVNLILLCGQGGASESTSGRSKVTATTGLQNIM